MTIAKTLKKFEALKSAILADGKVDEDEVEVLLDFIAPYCRAHNRDFMELNKLLVVSNEDGKITREESDALIQSINNVSNFLEKEKKVETVIAWVLGAGILVLSAIALVQEFFFS